MRVRRVRFVAWPAALGALASVATFVACTLNPQPLPPSDDFSGDPTSADAGSRTDASGFGATPENPAEDSGAVATPTSDGDGGDEGGDRSDGGDGGDAGSTDASDDGG